MEKLKYDIPMIERYDFDECDIVKTSSPFGGDIDEGEF